MKIDDDAVFKATTKKPLSAKEIVAKLGLNGSSSAARVRTLLFKLCKKGQLKSALRRGNRGRPAVVYSRV